MKRLIKLSETLQNFGYDNELIYDSVKEIISKIDSELYEININNNVENLIDTINLIDSFLYDIKIKIEKAKSNGQDNEDFLGYGNNIIEDLENEIQEIEDEIEELQNNIEASNKQNRLKKTARFICHIHDEIIEYCDGSMNVCQDAIYTLGLELTDMEFENLINDFSNEITHSCVWMEELIKEAEDANTRMSNGIIRKNDIIDELTSKLENLQYELSELSN